MVKLQRKISEDRGVVMDGRDIGTVVFPEADIKIFLTANADVRAGRRHKEMLEKVMRASYDEILENIRLRDHQDSTREASPLKRAADAIDLDNSDMSMEEQMDWFREQLKKLGSEN
jgi:cytidylate kinase